jgi:hypothetical protein
MAERNARLPADRLMQFRLGVHMGDVMAFKKNARRDSTTALFDGAIF